MANRPNFLELPPPPKLEDSFSRGFLSPRAFGSPRIGHVNGEVPPALSPLDALAAQGRLLAKQLDESAHNGKRMSRVPPYAIANSLAQTRPGYFRSVSAEPSQFAPPLPPPPPAISNDAAPVGSRNHLKTHDVRPVSHYPHLSAASAASSEYGESPVLPPSDFQRPARHDSIPVSDPVVLTPLRTQSPELIPSGLGIGSVGAMGDNISHVERDQSLDVAQGQVPVQHSLPARAAASKPAIPLSLTPGRNPSTHPGPSIRSVPPESPEDAQASSLELSIPSLPRKFSSGSAMSTPPRSPFYPPPPRSPSGGSERSLGAPRVPRIRANFSRPLSRASRPSLDMPSRQNSSDSQPGVFTDDNVGTPVSMTSDEYFDASERLPGPAPTYVYSTFSLPRGRVITRTSPVMREEPQQHHQFVWERPSITSSNVKLALVDDSGRRSTPPTQTPARDESPRQGQNPSRNIPDRARSRSVGAKASHTPSPDSQGRPSETAPPLPLPASLQIRPGLTTAVSNDAIDARKSSKVASRELTIEDHVNKGIECHEQGSLKESTYHLRIAAKANHPTAILLYALACRHGWGMRPNPREGVEWLRRAADMVGLEVADERDAGRDGSPAEVAQMKTRRAQFALSVYELGVSHMNGWGIEQDKALALRCFEIAGGMLRLLCLSLCLSFS